MKKLLRLIVGFGIGGIIVGTIAMRITVRMRQQTHAFSVYLAPKEGGEATEKTAERCAEIVREGATLLRWRRGSIPRCRCRSRCIPRR